MTVRVHGGKTEIIGPIIESSHLHGLLERIASLGLRLHSLAPLEAENTESRGQHTRARTHTTHNRLGSTTGESRQGRISRSYGFRSLRYQRTLVPDGKFSTLPTSS